MSLRSSAHIFFSILLFTLSSLLISRSSIFAAEAQFVVAFDPYFIGLHQDDRVIAVNQGESPIQLFVEAFDPFSGKMLDHRESKIILPGQGGLIAITDTIPQPHASRLMVYVKMYPANEQAVGEQETVTAFAPDPPFTITRLLVTSKQDTVLHVKGKPQPRDSAELP